MVVDKFIPPYPLKTAMLFLIFKRLDTTKQVFEAIKQAKPPKLYIAADGPRDHVEGEAEKVKAVREYVINNIDWDCEVKTLFREKNLGCGKAVSEAITWFFENEEQGIILEDDTVPSQSFFWFCEELLEKYKNEKKIWHIGGTNYQDGIIRGDGSYYFSALPHIWGWATWADRWKFYDLEMKDILDDKFIDNYWKGSAAKYWKKIFWKMKKFEIDTWDYQWTFTIWRNKGLSIIPNINLVKNIGFTDARSGVSKPDKNMMKATYEIDINKIIHPNEVKRSIDADIYSIKNAFDINFLTFLKMLIPKNVTSFIRQLIMK
jgi:hypothetical protein